MNGRRLDLDREPEEATDVLEEQTGKVESGWMVSQASFAQFRQHLIVRVPAAGHLGVQEVQCAKASDFYDEHDLLTGQRCHCGAQV